MAGLAGSTTNCLRHCRLAASGESGFDRFGHAVVGVGRADAPTTSVGEFLKVIGSVVHQDCGAGDFQHGDVVPVISDGEDLRGLDAAGGSKREERCAFGASGREDVEDGEVATRVFGAVKSDDGFWVGFADP